METTSQHPPNTTLKVRKISYNDTKTFILEIHYARRMPCIQYAYGLFDGERLIGVITYGQPASAPLCKGIAGESHRKDVMELNRLVILPEYNGMNYASILISKSLKMLPPGKYIVSYADSGWGHVGYVYQATNFLYTGQTKARTDKKAASGGHARHYKEGETKRQFRTAKYRYVYITGDRRTRRKLLGEMNYKVIHEYPKGDSVRYDIENPVPLIGLDIPG